MIAEACDVLCECFRSGLFLLVYLAFMPRLSLLSAQLLVWRHHVIWLEKENVRKHQIKTVIAVVKALCILKT